MGLCSFEHFCLRSLGGIIPTKQFGGGGPGAELLDPMTQEPRSLSCSQTGLVHYLPPWEGGGRILSWMVLMPGWEGRGMRVSEWEVSLVGPYCRPKRARGRHLHGSRGRALERPAAGSPSRLLPCQLLTLSLTTQLTNQENFWKNQGLLRGTG